MDFDLADITSSPGEGLQQPWGENFFHSEEHHEAINSFLNSMSMRVISHDAHTSRP